MECIGYIIHNIIFVSKSIFLIIFLAYYIFYAYANSWRIWLSCVCIHGVIRWRSRTIGWDLNKDSNINFIIIFIIRSLLLFIKLLNLSWTKKKISKFFIQCIYCNYLPIFHNIIISWKKARISIFLW